MNTFQECWKNWTKYPNLPRPDATEMSWINELNQAVFTRLEKNLPANVKVRTVQTPSFIYYEEAAGGYGVESTIGTCFTHRIKLPKDGTFEERVDAAVQQLVELIRGAETVFFYTPIVPCGALDHTGEPNRYMMSVRLKKAGWTVDVEEPRS